MQEIIGFIGSLCFAFSCWPQAYLSVKTGTARGIKWSFALLCLFGSFFCAVYALALSKYVLLPNYICSGLGASVILYIKIREYQQKTRKRS